MRFYFTNSEMRFVNRDGEVRSLAEISEGGARGDFELDKKWYFILIDGEPSWPTPNSTRFVVDVEQSIEMLRSESPTKRGQALADLHYVTKRRPADGVDAVPHLEPYLHEGDLATHLALNILVAIAGDYPFELAPLVDTLGEVIRSTASPTVKETAVECLAHVAREMPHLLLGLIPQLEALLVASQSAVRHQATKTLRNIAVQYPDRVSPCLDSLVSLAEPPASQRLAVLAIATIVKETQPPTPDAYPVLIESLVIERYSTRQQVLIAEGARKLGLNNQEKVRSHQSTLVRAFRESQTETQYRLLDLVNLLGSQGLSPTHSLVPPLLQLLEEEAPEIRKEACRALGALQAIRAVDQLKELEQEDPASEVRYFATWALSQIDHLQESDREK